MARVTLADVLDFLGDRVLEARPAADVDLLGQAVLSPGAAGCLSFASRRDEVTQQALSKTLSSVVLVLPEYVGLAGPDTTVVAVEKPRLEFARVGQRFFVPRTVPGIAQSAVIDDSAEIGADARIGPGVVVGPGCRIGDRVLLGANCVIGAAAWLGDDVVVGPGVVIGDDGFGYAREDDGTPVLIPHTGSVRIGNRVEIGANAAIDRGTIADTVIEDDVKIDNLVDVAHNCRVRRGAFVIATAVLCGGVDVGEEAWIAPNAVIRQQLTIGARATVGLSATVVRDVPPDAVVAGSPARPLKG